MSSTESLLGYTRGNIPKGRRVLEDELDRYCAACSRCRRGGEEAPRDGLPLGDCHGQAETRDGAGT